MVKKKKERGWMTAEEYVNTPEYQAQLEESERHCRESLKAYMEAARPVQEELAAAGFHVSEICPDLLRGGRYEAAVPILMKWIPQIKYEPLKDDMIRALAVPWAGSAVNGLLEEFPKDESDNIGWAIANSIAVIATDAVFEDIVKLARDKRYGRRREMLVLSLRRMKKRREEAIEVLLELLNDEEAIVGYALWTLFKMKAKVPAEAIKPFLEHSESWIRKEAKKLLKYAV